MIYPVSNDENKIKELLIQLREEYGDYAFISYIDGEYGTRVWVYNSLVYKFYNQMKSQNTICIGIVFKDTRCFIDGRCDHIIEIDDIEFLSTTTVPQEDRSQHSLNHINNVVTQSNYYGNDGWDLAYLRGLHSNLYESILLELNFSNIFYTLHVDGSRYINLHGCNNGYLYKINNENIIYPKVNNETCVQNTHICLKEDTREPFNKIVIWTRNSTKWPCKNIASEYYNALFLYCISNNKTCYVFQDLLPIDIPAHANIIDSTKRYKNRPDFDHFIKICSESDIFIGAESGPLYLLLHHPMNILKICACIDGITYGHNYIHMVESKDAMMDKINDYYTRVPI